MTDGPWGSQGPNLPPPGAPQPPPGGPSPSPSPYGGPAMPPPGSPPPAAPPSAAPPPSQPPYAAGPPTVAMPPYAAGPPTMAMPPVAAAPTGRPGGKKKGALIGGALAAVAAATVGIVVVTGGDDKPTTQPTTTVAQPSTTVQADTTTSVEEATTTIAPPPADLDSIAHSVVQITAEMADGTGIWTGSGTIISTDGLILTNAHVVENNGNPVFYDHLAVSITGSADALPLPSYRADVVAFGPDVDLAVIKISTDIDGNPVSGLALQALPIGDSDTVHLGDGVRLLGFPSIGGGTITLTTGSVSGFAAEAGVGERAWIKTDATIAGGNSGGTALNAAGQLIAIPTNLDTGDGEFADCRVLQDTNGDNVIDENDTCIPLGGFINGLRPVNLALPLIEQAQDGQIVPTNPGEQGGEINLDEVLLGPISFAGDVNVDDNTPIGPAEAFPSGTARVCAFFDYEGMVDGVAWDSVWSVEGAVDENLSLLNQEWIGGPNGANWWVCAANGTDPLPDGVYELTLYVMGESITSNTVFIGDYTTADITVTNATQTKVCYVRLSPPSAQAWGPDELTIDQTLEPGTSIVINEVATVYDVLAQDCDFNLVAELYGVDLTAGGEVVLS